MPEKAKQHLLDRLAETHLDIRVSLDKIDLELPVYADSGWRARDILGHIATWDQETARSINAYRAGSEYSIPDLDDMEVDYNERAVSEQKKLSDNQLINELEQAYDELRKSIQEMPVEMFSGEMLYPWGSERGSITKLVEYMLDHAVDHRDEIVKAMQG